MTARSSTFSRGLLATAAAVVVAALAVTPASADPPPAGAGTTENAQEALDGVGLGSLPDLGGCASRQRPAPGSTSGNFLWLRTSNERRQIVVPASGSMKPGCPIPLDPAG